MHQDSSATTGEAYGPGARKGGGKGTPSPNAVSNLSLRAGLSDTQESKKEKTKQEKLKVHKKKLRVFLGSARFS